MICFETKEVFAKKYHLGTAIIDYCWIATADLNKAHFWRHPKYNFLISFFFYKPEIAGKAGCLGQFKEPN